MINEKDPITKFTSKPICESTINRKVMERRLFNDVKFEGS